MRCLAEKKQKSIPYLMFSYVGIIFISLGTFKIEMADNFGVDTSTLQYIFGFFSLFNMFGIFLNRYLLERISPKLEIIFASFLIITGVFGLILSSTKSVLTCSLSVLALGTGFYFSLSNYLVVNLNRMNRVKNMNFLHFCYACACISTPTIAAFFVKAGFSWKMFYILSIVFPTSVMLFSFKVDIGINLDDTPKESRDGRERWPLLTYLAIICLFSYVFSEMVFNFWILEYLVQRGNDKELAKLAISIFWVAVALGRFYNSRHTSSLGELKRMIFTSAGALAAYCFLLQASSISLSFILAAVAGFFYSGMYALIVSVGTLGKKKVSSLLATSLMFSGSLGAIFVSPVTASVKQVYGIDTTMRLGILAMFIIFFISILYELVFRRISKESLGR